MSAAPCQTLQIEVAVAVQTHCKEGLEESYQKNKMEMVVLMHLLKIKKKILMGTKENNKHKKYK